MTLIPSEIGLALFYIMSALSTNPNISKLGEFRHDNGPGVLQKIDDEVLNLVRKALEINDLLFVVLVRELLLLQSPIWLIVDLMLKRPDL